MTDDERTGASHGSPLDPFGVLDAWSRAFQFNAPLSGAVNQAIQAALLHNLGQLGLVNITTAAAGDPALERRVVEQVASYGRQLGWVLDALDVLIRAHRGGPAAAGDERALAQVEELHGQVEALKARALAERADRLVADVRTLLEDPEGNAATLAALRAALLEEAPANGSGRGA